MIRRLFHGDSRELPHFLRVTGGTFGIDVMLAMIGLLHAWRDRGYRFSGMTPKQPTSQKGGKIAASGPAKQTETPQWANGLRQLYDSVVDEDLPDSFKDLLSKLDADD